MTWAREPEDDWAADVDLDKVAPAPSGSQTLGEGAAMRLETLRARMLDAKGLDELEDPSPLIDGVLTLDSLAVLYGRPGNGKSFVALDWALCVSSGCWWHGKPVVQGPVIYLVAEGAKGMKKRTKAWMAHQHFYQSENLGDIVWLPMAVNMLDAEWADALVVAFAERHPVLVIIDTLSRTMPGGNENAPEVMSRWVHNADRIRRATGACVAVVAHTPKDGGTIRGHSSLEGAAETTIETVKGGSMVTLTNAKAKDDPEFEPMRLALLPVEEASSCVLEELSRIAGLADEHSAGVEQLRATVLEVCMTPTDGPAVSTTALMDASGMPKATFYRCLKVLVLLGEVVNIGSGKSGRWVLPDDPSVS